MKDWLCDLADHYFDSEDTNLEKITETIPEDISRREILLIFGSAIGVGGVVLPIPVRVDKKLSRAERRFMELVTTIEESDIKDPQQVHNLKNRVTVALDSVETVLRNEAVHDGQQVDDTKRDLHDLFSILPGVDDPPTKSRTTRRMSALSKAHQYYSDLEDTLGESILLLEQLRESETKVLYYDKEAPPKLLKHRAIESFAESVKQLPTDENTLGPTRVSGLNRLHPPLQSVVDQLEKLREIYATNITAQQAYLESGLQTEKGARQHEQSNLSEAQKAFEQGQGATQVDISDNHFGYALQTTGLTLGEYHQIFAIRRGGIEKLTMACDSKISESTRQTKFNKGLDRLFDARQLVTAGSSSF
jgi:hypothetical protein